MASLTIFGITILLLVVYWRLARTRKAALINKYFDGPRKIPILGNIAYLIGKKELIDLLIDLLKQYPRLRIGIGEEVTVIISKADDVEAIITSNNLNKATLYDIMAPFAEGGLFLLKGNEWKPRRKLASPGFQSQLLVNYLEIFESNVEMFIENLQRHVNKGTFNIHEITTLLALDNISETALGAQINAQKNPENVISRDIDIIFKMLIDQLFKPWLKNEYLLKLSSCGVRYLKALENVDSFISETVEKRRAQFNSEKNAEDDDFRHLSKRKYIFLDLLLDSGLPDDDIKNEVKTIFAAGYDTLAAALAFAFYALSQNPEIQEKVYEEQMEVMGNSKIPATAADLSKMKYLDRVIKETLRVYPTAGLFGRILQEDVQLKDGAVIPKEVNVYMFANALHMDPEVWDKPDEFNPDRFLPELVASRHTYAYIPFSIGPRNCLGKGYAQLQMKSVIGRGVRHFKFLPCAETDKINLEWHIVLSSKNGINLQIQERT